MITKDIFQLCNSINEVEALNKGLNNPNYLANIKFDGERIIAIVLDEDVILMNRRGKVCNIHFREIVEDLKKLPNCILDGEIISLDDDFNMLMKRAMTKTLHKLKDLEKEVPVKYMVFDCLKIDNTDIRHKPLSDRIIGLNGLFHGLNFTSLELAEYGDIKDMLAKAKKEDREGLIIKDMTACYESRRTDNWKKLKRWCEGTLKAIKYEENPKGITLEDDKGNRVSCLGEQSKEVKHILDSKGEVKVYVQYLEKTADDRMRFPSFRGLV